MLLGIKSKKKFFLRHLLVALLSLGIYYLFWLSRPDWSPEHRLWRGTGDASFVLLFLALMIGPLSNLWKFAQRFLSWRRELGIWFAVVAVIHGFVILDGWLQWSLMRMMGYEFVPQLERYALVEPGFGLANLMGLTALFFALVLAATSSDRMVNFLGVDSWKWLHYFAYVVFYISTLHAIYFLFLHFGLSGHRPAPDPNWFRWPMVGMALSVVLFQIIGFISVVRRNRKSDWY